MISLTFIHWQVIVGQDMQGRYRVRLHMPQMYLRDHLEFAKILLHPAYRLHIDYISGCFGLNAPPYCTCLSYTYLRWE